MDYINLQKEWIKENNIKQGSRVKVLTKSVTYKNGWKNGWVPAMNNFINIIFTLDENFNNNQHGIYLNCGYSFPYFSLKKISKNLINNLQPNELFHICNKEL